MRGAGSLDRRVRFLRAALQDDGFQSVEVFAPYGMPVWAARRDVSDAERQRAGQEQAYADARFTIRSSEFTRGLRPADRLICDGRTYDIIGVKELGRMDWLEISAQARADE